MKSFVAFCVLFLAAVALARPDDHYTDRYDNVDLDEILSNKRLLVPYVKCMLDQGKCAPDAKELKDHIREALENDCGKCTPKQKNGTKRVIKHMINNEEGYWKELTAKYDPDNKYSTKYEKELREITAVYQFIVQHLNSKQFLSIKMKSFVALCVLFVASVCVARPDDHYTDKYDNVDLDEILSNRRLLVPYIKCMLDQGKCAPDGKELKAHIKEALENDCDKCTEAQKKGTDRVLKHMINNEEEFWKELTAKYDPENKYATKYEEKLREAKE
ncbi:uncharacterized protein LOC142980184 [Anticarsia gemmatalis]|uniref:uncharacterized protein LOC142980184 n=1 Tax=Anticarsia gemmatalis TaxID=129554 RepID=UPI003F75D1CC